MYDIAQESPDCAASVWSRRIGYLHKAHMKRLRDSELIQVNDEFTAWPSSGVLLLFRVIGHIFPVTDKKHPIIMPTILFLCQILTSTPILSTYDIIAGLYCSGILIEYTKEAKRVVPEVHGFLASIIRLFASNPSDRSNLLRYPLPNVGASSNETTIQCLREHASKFNVVASGNHDDDGQPPIPMLSLEKEKIMIDDNKTAVAILHSALQFSEVIVQNLAATLDSAAKEAFFEITESVLCLHPKSKTYPLPKYLQMKISSFVGTLQNVCQFDHTRVPLQRRSCPTLRGVQIKTYAPLYENPDKFSLSKDKGKNATQTASDRIRREYKREHKAVTRELKLDGTYIEHERRVEMKQKLDIARNKRHKAYAWLENEQATMNQQVRQGGSLLQGGGMGAAKAKARTNQLGIKKGGKF
jgi:nucleolar protein 14